MHLQFHIQAEDPGSRARRGVFVTPHGCVDTPAFMTVGTRASVTGLTPADLVEVGTQVVLGNTYHLMLRPGVEVFERVGGIHRFMGWGGPMLTDSGGYQIFSLSEDRVISEKGARFRSYTDRRMHMLSPEKSIAVQTAIGADIMMVLDVCVDARSDLETTRAAMERTHRWALRSLAARRDTPQALFAIMQGGIFPELRRASAEFLTGHPFDGFAIGGLAVGDTRAEREEVTHMAAELLPADRPRYLMGVGTPPDLLHAMLAGVDMFDCILPTNLGWQGTAFTSTGRVKLTRGFNAGEDRPLDAGCSCATCRTWTRAYIHHLFRCGEALGPRLLAMHNLHHYNALMVESRAAIAAGCFAAYAREKLERIDRHEHSDRRIGAAA
ncbi:tRNA guanosine(34) transglycosylase Tgt [Nannocystis sp.]|uniref:tRNA guanosine(34) transglycosylase Tgt n=1 Tax=Nannocystis sp. TaxID=1962667 RepID=UPI0025E5742A|nr:tRNA guanosine(34) transglycosylase Tgt [Nannocystis sp.]